MANIFEDMDNNQPAGADVATAPGQVDNNVFAQMDAQASPIDRALAKRAEDVAAYQARAQEDYMRRQEEIKAFDKAHPELAPPAFEREHVPLWDPYLPYREQPIASRETKTKAPMGSGFSAAMKMDLLSNPETKRRVLAQTLFPNDPDAYYRVGFDAHGDPVYVGDDNQLHKIASGTARFGANLVANSPEMVGATLGALAGPGGSALTAAGAHGIKRLIAGQVYDEQQDALQNAKEMAIEGLSAGAGETIGRLGIAARNASRPRVEFPAAEIAAGEAVRNRVLQNTGVNLNLADASDDPYIKAIYQYGWRQPGQPSRNLRAARMANDLEFNAATNNVLNQVAAGEPAEVTGQRAVNAAQEAMRRAQTRANDIADPYYHAAWAAHPVIRDPTVLSFFRLPEFEQAFYEGQRLARMENAGLQQLQPPNLQSMDYWLRALRARRDQLQGTQMAPGSDPQMAGAMTLRINELDQALRTAYPELQAARTVYATARRALVEPLENGKVGVLASIDEPNARQAAVKLFADNVSPEHIADTRRVIEGVNPQAWSGVVRQWLASKWDESLQRTQSAEVRNAPGKFQAQVFGTPREEAIAREMLTPQQYQAFNELMFAAQRLASTPVGGSTTAADTAISKALEGPINSVMQVVTSVRHPFQTAEGVARQAGRERNILNLTNAILDPTQRDRIAIITRMRPGRAQATLLASVLSEEAAKRAIQSQQPMGPNTELVAGEEDAVGQ